ncbi:Anti-Sigma Factor A [compost metagenome]
MLVEVLNDYGFRSSYGKPYTYMSYRQMMDRADQKMIRDFISEIQHEPVSVLLPF